MTTDTEKRVITEEAGLCARLLAQEEGERVLSPDTPANIPGNAQYAFEAIIPPALSPLPLRIVWPSGKPEEAPAGFEYPGNDNFSTVVPEILFLSRDRRNWERIPATERTPEGARLILPPSPESRRLSVGVPFHSWQLEELYAELEEAPHIERRRIGQSAGGRPLYAFVVSPSAATQSGGVFFLQAYQHYSEWAGLHALGELLRLFAREPATAGPFRWALVPCLNVDALYGGWREDPMHNGEDVPGGGNLNRDWREFHFPETRAALDFYRSLATESEVLHGLDLHMGWSRRGHSGGGLTVFEPGTIPKEAAARERAFTEAFFDRVPIERFPWERSSPERPNFACWMWREFGRIGQTVEISRFRAFSREGEARSVSQSYYESLGPALADALTAFHAHSPRAERQPWNPSRTPD